MATDGTYKIASIPAGTDLVSRAAIAGEFTKMDAGLAHMVALQNNSSTTAYTTDAPYSAYYAGMRFQFVALYANTGGATLNVNSLGAKKLCDPTSGLQLSAAGAIAARQLYWLEYDTTLDSGAGAFRVYSQYVDLVSSQSIAGTKTFNDPIVAADTVSPLAGSNFMITPEGGFAVKLTNKTGSASVKGSLLKASGTYDNSVALCGAGDRNIAAFMYSDGVADGSDVWVVTAGVAQAKMASGSTATRGQHCVISSTENGRARSMSDPGDSEFFCGRFLESVSAGGLARIIITWRQDG